MKRLNFTLLASGFVFLAGCAATAPYGHGDVVVGKKAIFRHKTSKMEKLECTECHDKLFTNARQHQKHNMQEIFSSAESCGVCHNGTRTFSVRGNCDRCHRKG